MKKVYVNWKLVNNNLENGVVDFGVRTYRNEAEAKKDIEKLTKMCPDMRYEIVRG